ncbi:hypothetical protein BH09BAC1_BH09BAC1_28800 [soil metagenome]
MVLHQQARRVRERLPLTTKSHNDWILFVIVYYWLHIFAPFALFSIIKIIIFSFGA